MKPVLITGAAGVVGSALARDLIGDFPDCVLVDREFKQPARPGQNQMHCDLESQAEVQGLMARVRPEVVIHAAGNKDVFALEQAPELARRANVDTTRNVMRALAGSNTFLIFISTDYVFEGTSAPYHERSVARPTTEYGKSKLLAEECLLASGLSVAIARSAALFGFPNDFVSAVTAKLRAGSPFGAFSDLVSSPTFVGDLAQMLRRLMARRLTGVFHLCGCQSLSREEFARTIALTFGLDPTLVRPESRNERVRPPDLSLLNAATCAALDYEPWSLLTALKSMVTYGTATES